MGRRFTLPFLFLAIVLSSGRTAAALTFYDIWNLKLSPHTLFLEKASPDHLPEGEMSSTPTTEEPQDNEEGAGGLETRVDFGTKAWPYVYYARRDGKGTVDWGTMSWPYIYYSKQDGKKKKEAKSDDATGTVLGADVKPIPVRHGRKCGSQIKI